MSSASINRLVGLLLFAFIAIAVSLTYWSVFAADDLLTRPDNPRYAEAQQAVRRGALYDRNGTVLADSVDGGLAASGLAIVRREYPEQTALSATGFYSPQAQSGVEQAFNATLTGDDRLSGSQRTLNDLLHLPQTGSDIRLTIDLPMQKAAAAAVQVNPSARGAVVAIDAQTGAVRVMLSLPTYDPAVFADINRFKQLLADPSTPLVNRALQGMYPPGGALETVILTALLAEKTTLTQPITGAAQPVVLPGLTLNCDRSDAIQTLGDAYAEACPFAFAQAASDQPDAVQHTIEAFGLLRIPPLVGFQPDQLGQPSKIRPLSTLSGNTSLLQAQGAGQGDLSVSPLQMALVAAAIAGHGNIMPPYLVEATRAPDGQWQPVSANAAPIAVTSQDVADTVQTAMQAAVTYGAANAAAAPGLTIYGHAALAFTGPNKQPIAWFIGFVTLANGHSIAIAVVLENAADQDMAAAVGGAVLQAAAAETQ